MMRKEPIWGNPGSRSKGHQIQGKQRIVWGQGYVIPLYQFGIFEQDRVNPARADDHRAMSIDVLPMLVLSLQSPNPLN